jgi:hypothetical protein
MGRAGTPQYFRPEGAGSPDAVRSGRRRRRARLPGRWRADVHLHGLPGPLADDPQHVQDFRRTSARRLSCQRARHRRTRPVHLRRPSGRHGLSPDRLCHAGLQFRAGVHGPVPGRSPVLYRVEHPLPAFLRRFPHLPRSAEDRGHRLRRHQEDRQLRSHCRIPQPRHEPDQPGHSRYGSEPRHLLPGPRSLQRLLRPDSFHRRRADEEGCLHHRPFLQALRLRRSPPGRARHRGHGFRL